MTRLFASLAVLVLAIGVARATPHVRSESTIAADHVAQSLRSPLNSTVPPPRTVFDFELGVSDHKKPENDQVPASQRFKKPDPIYWDRG